MTESFSPLLFVYPHFLCTTCVALWLFVLWKRCGRGSCYGHNSHLVHPKTLLLDRLEHAKKRNKKSRKHLLRRASDSRKKICRLTPAIFFRTWQISLAVTSSTWQTGQLYKLTWQVDSGLSPCPLVTLQFTWQVITCQVDLSSWLEQSSYHASVGLCFLYTP